MPRLRPEHQTVPADVRQLLPALRPVFLQLLRPGQVRGQGQHQETQLEERI